MSLVHASGCHQAAFRCKNCGHLVHAEHAGENELPHACPVCKAGVAFVLEEPAQKRADAIMAELTNPGLDREKGIALARELSALPRKKALQPDNWEVLAQATPERLKELGLDECDVCAHQPEKITDPVERQRVSAVNT
jgi:phage FluMu protein Com